MVLSYKNLISYAPSQVAFHPIPQLCFCFHSFSGGGMPAMRMNAKIHA